MHHHVRLAAGLVAFSTLATTGASADRIYVDADAPGGTGTTWGTALSDLQQALAQASAGDEIWVADGVYLPTAGTDRNATFAIPAGVSVYGGFAGDEMSIADRDLDAHETVLSGDLARNDGSGWSGREDNVYTVVTVTDTADEAVVLDGLTISDGNADEEGSQPRFRGGGLFSEYSTLQIRNCTVRHNTADLQSIAWIGSCDCVFEDCYFVDNLTFITAGCLGIVDDSTYEFHRCDFMHNDGGFGGALYVTNSSTGLLIDCRLVNNRSSFIGGGATLGPATLVNCLIARNSATHGAGVYLDKQAVVVNCTIAHNTGGAGLEIATNVGEAEVFNTIVWGNDASFALGSGGEMDLITISFSNIEGGWAGNGVQNIDADPSFAGPGVLHYGLSFGSPALDAGANSALAPLDFDVDFDLVGQPRIQDGTVDMGAYEGPYEPLPPAAMDDDIDAGEAAVLVPGSFDFPGVLESTFALVLNDSEEDDQTASIFELPEPPSASGGLEAFGVTLQFQDVSMDDGEFRATVSIPFTAADLGSVAPEDLFIAGIDPGTNRYGVAVCLNTDADPQAPGYGTRTLQLAGGAVSYVHEKGRSGVFWDPTTQRGVAWAVVDYAGVFSLGVSHCDADVAQPPDGAVDIADLELIIDQWGASGAHGPSDTDNDGLVGLADLLAVIGRWGVCSDDELP